MSRRKFFVRCAALVLMPLAAGCATPPLLVPAQTDSAPSAPMLARGGRFAVHYTDHGHAQAVQGQFLWQTSGTVESLELRSPLGQALARISASTQGAELYLPGQEARHGPSAEHLTKHALGFELPISGFGDWLQARPHPRGPALVEEDERGRPSQIRQDGWQIDYPRYYETELLRPRRIDISRDSPAGPLEIRLVLDEAH